MTIEGKLITKYFKTTEDFNAWKGVLVAKYSDYPIDGETWLPIPGFSMYEASDFGRLWSLNYKRSGVRKLLTPALSTDDYLKTVLLNDSGKYKTIAVHRIIALTHIGERTDGLEVNHKDGVKTNNYATNLEYVTHAENVRHSIANGLQIPFKGSQVGTSKLTEDQVLELRRLKKERGRFWGRNEIAKKLGMAPKHLQKIVNSPNEVWKHI